MKEKLSLSTEKYLAPILREQIVEERRQARVAAQREMIAMFAGGTFFAVAMVALFQVPAISHAIQSWWGNG